MKNSFQNEQMYQNHKKLLNKKMKTMESIGTFNQTPEYLDRSIVCKRDIFLNNPFTLQQKEKQSVNLSQISRITKIQNQVNDITKMKMMYQSRLNYQKNQKLHTKSIEKSTHTKSIQKHILKPTNTPSFNRVQNRKITNSVSQSHSSLQFHRQTLLKFSQIDNKNTFKNQISQREISNSGKKQSQFEDQTKKSQNYEFLQQFNLKLASSYNNDKNREQMFQRRSNNSETPKKILFTSSCKSKDPPNYRKQQVQNKESENKKSQIQPLQFRKIQQSNKKHTCDCEQKMRLYMQHTNNKMAQITQRLMYLQNQNYKLKLNENKITQYGKTIEKIQQKMEALENQNYFLRQSNGQCQNQKQQLQLMLKQILFKRQRQKMHQSSHSSKQSTHRHNSEQISNYNPKSQNNSQNYEDLSQRKFRKNGFNDKTYQPDQNTSTKSMIKIIQPLGNKNLNIEANQKQNNSRMKVQNLLSKLQIKIEKN